MQVHPGDLTADALAWATERYRNPELFGVTQSTCFYQATGRPSMFSNSSIRRSLRLPLRRLIGLWGIHRRVRFLPPEERYCLYYAG